MCAFRCHGLLEAMRTLVKNLVQSFCAVGLGNEDVVFLLIFIFVVLQSVFEVIVDLRYAHFFNLLGGECQGCHGVERNLALFAEVPEGGVQVVAVVYDGDYRNLCALNERTHRVGHIGCNAAGGVARFGIHAKHVTLTENVIDGLDERQVGDVLAGTDGTNELHEPRATVEAVKSHYVVHSVGSGDERGQFKIDKELVCGKDHIRGLETLHANLFNFKLFANEHHFGKEPNEPNNEHWLTDGTSCIIVAFFIFVVNLNISVWRHKPSRMCYFCVGFLNYLIYYITKCRKKQVFF